MGVIVTEVYDALVAAGAPEDKARAAAAVREGAEVADKANIARLDARLDGLDQRLGTIDARLSVVVTIPELARELRDLRERIDAPNWKSIVIQTIAIVALISFVLRVL